MGAPQKQYSCKWTEKKYKVCIEYSTYQPLFNMKKQYLEDQFKTSSLF